jgi:hypothetical protein
VLELTLLEIQELFNFYGGHVSHHRLARVMMTNAFALSLGCNDGGNQKIQS